MGEEEKKPPTPEAAKEEETAKVDEPAEGAKKEEKKSEESKGGEPAAPAPMPPSPPPEIVLRVFMHCEACARKVRRCLKGFEGVEEVITDCRASKVIVKGEKADPVKVLERLQKKSHRQVNLISPIPKPPAEEPPKPPEKEAPKTQEKKEEPQVISVVLRVYMHCDACAQEIKRRILRMKGVECVEPDMKSSKVTVKGLVEPQKLCDYVHKRTGKHATIINVELAKKEEAENAKSKEENEAPEEIEKDAAKKADQESKEAAVPPGGEGGEQPTKVAPMPAGGELEEPMSSMESRKNELLMYNQYPQNFQMYPQRYVQEMNSYPPQMFSDENPNACCVM